MSAILREFIDACNDVVNELNAKISDINTLVNIDAVPDDYLRNLANLIGADLSAFDVQTNAEFRNFIRNAVGWYKIKGLYQAINVILYVRGIKAQIWDMWTLDYSDFVLQSPSIETPPGIDYYKSPHFSLEIVLDTVLGSYPNEYLLAADMLTFVENMIEEVRPVHTVPHYGAFLNPKTYEDHLVHTVAGNIRTKVTAYWDFVRLYFDMSSRSSEQGWYFDTGKYFDWSYDSIINSVTVWKLGIGNRNISPDDPAFSLQSPVLVGTVDEITIGADKITYEFTVPTSVVQSGISELGLYLTDGTTLMVVSTFPTIDKAAGDYLRVSVDILKS